MTSRMLAVEQAGGPHARGRPVRQQADADVGRDVEPAAAGDLEAHDLAPLRRRPAERGVGGVAAEVLLGQVDATAVQVLADVAQEVGQLEGVAQVPGVRRRGGRIAWFEDGQHHLADDRGRAVHVAAQVRPRLVAGDGEVHRHRAQEAAEALRVDGEGAHGVHDRLEHRIVALAAVEVGEEALAERGQRRGPVPPWDQRRRPSSPARRRCRPRSGRRRRARGRGGA